MTPLIKQIQKTLEHGRPIETKMGPVAEQVLKEIQKQTRTVAKEAISKPY